MNCPLCQREMVALFTARDYRRPDDPAARTAFWCAACGYGRIGGHFTEADVAPFYQIPYYTHQNESAQLPEERSFLDKLRVHLAWRCDRGINLTAGEIGVSESSPRTMCDVGCGAGEQLRNFHAAGFEVVGVEPDARARSAAASQQVGPVFDGTAERMPAEVNGRQFDVVLLSHVLEHCIDPLNALRNVKSILAPGGKAVVEVPNSAALGFSRFGALWPWADIPRHLHFFSEKSLRAFLELAGLPVTRTHYVGYTRQFQGDWIEWQNRIWSQLEKRAPPNFKLDAWTMLLRTAFAPAARKYDSVRVHAECPTLPAHAARG